MSAGVSGKDSAAEAEFDAYCEQYEAALAQGLRYSGEGPEYFARRRIAWVARLLQRAGVHSPRVLDFGCGIGLATPHLRHSLNPRAIWGYDPSQRAVARARAELGDDNTLFTADAKALPTGQIDAAYVNGVFHHIAPHERPAALEIIQAALKPGGWFAFWENNPWNPGTRYVMKRVPFDRDAIVITPPAARRLLRDAGFRVQRTDAWFLFPRSLAWLRPLEHLVHRLPLGGQYLLLAQKPSPSNQALGGTA